MENVLKVNPKNVTEQYEKQIRELTEAYGEAHAWVEVPKRVTERHLASTEE